MQVPRTPNFLGNYLGIKDKASALRLYPKFQDEFVGIFDFIYQKRLETQLAVDDLVESIVNELDAQGEFPHQLFDHYTKPQSLDSNSKP